jgi:glucose/arabinose dehydrogenase
MERHLYIEHLHSPFSIHLVGDTPYVANTANIMRYGSGANCG